MKRFQTFTGVRNGNLRNLCTIDSGAMVTLATATVSDVAVVSGSLAVPVPVLARDTSSSVMVGVAKLRIVVHPALNSTVVGRCPRRKSLANSRTVLSSDVVIVNDGVIYCAPPRGSWCAATDWPGRSGGGATL